jgi:hypothetical protein
MVLIGTQIKLYNDGGIYASLSGKDTVDLLRWKGG